MAAMKAGTALVTGGARRIGRAIVEDLSAHGFAVAIHCAGSADEAQALANAILAQGGSACVVQADLTDPEQAKALVERASAQIGPVDLLVNNASIFERDSLDSLDPTIWDRHFAIHVRAPVLLSAAFASALPQGRDGLIVNIIDQRVWRLTPSHFSYTLSKSAQWTATRTMAQALAPRIRVNAIGPGPSLKSERQRPEDFERQTASVPLGRGPSLDEFGATVRYLWEARSLTGQMIALDGGQHLAWQTPDVTGIVE